MTVAEARIAIVKAKKKAQKLSAEIGELKEILIKHEKSLDPEVLSFQVRAAWNERGNTVNGTVTISKGKDFEKFNSAALKRKDREGNPDPYLGGRNEIFNHLSHEDKTFWLGNSSMVDGNWTVYLSKK